jgi:hypothetical protein
MQKEMHNVNTPTTARGDREVREIVRTNVDKYEHEQGTDSW